MDKPLSLLQACFNGTVNPGSELWGEQAGTGPQTYVDWQASNYQYNSIYKQLHPYTSATEFVWFGSFIVEIGDKAITTYPYYDPLIYCWIVNKPTITITPNYTGVGYNAIIGTTPGGNDISINAPTGIPINFTIEPSNKSIRYYITVKNGNITVGVNTIAVMYPLILTQVNGNVFATFSSDAAINQIKYWVLTDTPIIDQQSYIATNGTGSITGIVFHQKLEQ